MRIALAQINPTIGALSANREKILRYITEARIAKADIILFPELSLCGYPPKDLLLLPDFIQEMEHSLQWLAPQCKGILAIIGTVRPHPKGERGLCNAACIIENGAIRGFQDKILLPNYDVFSERRYFDPGKKMTTWSIKGKEIAILICEDMWHHEVSYEEDPLAMLQGKKVDLIFNLSASPFYKEGVEKRETVASYAALQVGAPLVFVNQVGGNDSLLFDGHSFVIDQECQFVARCRGFMEEILYWDMGTKQEPILEEESPLLEALIMGTRDYFHKVGFQKAVLGLSGGIDSALVAYIAVQALGKENVTALFMPSRFTSKESREDALAQATRLAISFLEISIESPFKSYLELLTPFLSAKKEGDVMEENLQARIRGMILMAYSNREGAMVVSTGNKSELAVGYSTLYGDMCGGLMILGDVMKGEVVALCQWINRKEEIILKRIIEKPPTAELREGQKDSDTLPPYEILDRIITGYVHEHLSAEKIASQEGMDLSLVRQIVRKIHRNEYKRHQSAPLLRVTKKSLTEGRTFPIAEQWCEGS